MSSALLVGSAVTLAMRGTTGAFGELSANASCIRSAAGLINSEWKGADTGRGKARLAPAFFAAAIARSTAAAAPEMTSCPPPLSLAIWHDAPDRDASTQSASTRSSSRPMIAAIAPSPTGTADCMASPRIRRSFAACPTPNDPAAASAEYSPNEWPATKATSRSIATPSLSSARIAASETAINAGCALLVSCSSSASPSHIKVLSFWPSASSTSSNTVLDAANSSASALPMPICWLPCPGNMNAILKPSLPLCREGACLACATDRQAWVTPLRACASRRLAVCARGPLQPARIRGWWLNGGSGASLPRTVPR